MALLRERLTTMRATSLSILLVLFISTSAFAGSLPPAVAEGSRIASLTTSNGFHYEEVTFLGVSKSGWVHVSFKRCTKIFEGGKSVVLSGFEKDQEYQRWIQLSHITEIDAKALPRKKENPEPKV